MAIPQEIPAPRNDAAPEREQESHAAVRPCEINSDVGCTAAPALTGQGDGREFSQDNWSFERACESESLARAGVDRASLLSPRSSS